MNINIKEIFKSDLDPNSTDWWSNDKIDKLNYNFYQLASGGTPGPMGNQGPDGDFGEVGAIGPLGNQGPIGSQGPQGVTPESNWVYYPDGIGSPGYLFPKYLPSTPQISPIVTKIGVKNTDPEYSNPGSVDEYTVLSNTNTGIDSIDINLRIRHQNISTSAFSDFSLESPKLLKIGRINSGAVGFTMVHYAEKTHLKTITAANSVESLVHNISDSLIKIDSRPADPGLSIPEGTAIIGSSAADSIDSNDRFIYTKDASEGKILSSIDNLGTSVWKEKREVLPSFPIGIVISIREEDFNDTNFYLDEVLQTSPTGVVKNRWGRGKNGTEFEGWYLCNGETWKFDTLNYKTPNLNSFHYNIDGNGFLQPTITGAGSDAPIILGGYDISMVATESNVVNGQYTVEFSNSWEDNDTSPLPDELKVETNGSATIPTTEYTVEVYEQPTSLGLCGGLDVEIVPNKTFTYPISQGGTNFQNYFENNYSVDWNVGYMRIISSNEPGFIYANSTIGLDDDNNILVGWQSCINQLPSITPNTYVSRMIHIVYLESNRLYWENDGLATPILMTP